MSAENPITQPAVEAAVNEALAVISAATDLASLKAARQTTVGEQSAIAKLNAQMKCAPKNSRP